MSKTLKGDRKMRAIFIDGNCNKYNIPKKFHKFYDNKPIANDVFQLYHKEYLELLEFFTNANVPLSRSFYLDSESNDVFKGTGFINKMKVAFYGDKYGATKLAITYREFRKKKLGRVEILTLNEEINSFFNKANNNHKIKENNE
jgi:hypothetical protein